MQKVPPMPPPRWLLSLIPGAARDDAARREVAALSAAVRRETNPAVVANLRAQRMVLAASDSSFVAKREAAVRRIIAAIDAVARPAGYRRKGQIWTLNGPVGETSIILQRSSYGFECFINLGFRPTGGLRPTGIWGANGVVRLGQFYAAGAPSTTEPGTISYLDVIEDPASLEQPMNVLASRALPWLAAHKGWRNPDIAAFLPSN